MARVCLFVLAALLAVCPAPFSVAHPNGAPATACEHMTPGHRGIPPQNGPSPYTIQVKNGTAKYGEAFDVHFTGPDYAGILLVFLEVNSTKPLGTWKDPPENTKVLQCSGIGGSAITHANPKPKTSSTTYHWVAPENYCQKTFIIKATIAQGFDTYWIGITKTIPTDASATCGSGGSSSPGSAFDVSGSSVGSSLNGSSSGPGVNGSSSSPGGPWVRPSSGNSDASVTSGACKLTWNPTILLLLVVHMCLQLGRLRQLP